MMDCLFITLGVIVLPALYLFDCPVFSLVSQAMGQAGPVNWKKATNITPKGFAVQLLLASLEKPLQLFLFPVFAAYVA